MAHGKAVMPFGIHKGVRVRHLPDAYLSWLVDARGRQADHSAVLGQAYPPILADPRWRWLLDSVLSELKHRGLRADLALEDLLAEPMPEPVLPVNTLHLFEPEPPPIEIPKRRIILEDE